MKGITRKLINWYGHNRRDLPWRQTRDPYLIWVSEIILQQTRVDQGYDYYLRFIRRFPGVRSLAEAEPDEVMKMWQGLGYYSRARNMQFAARQIMENCHGVFPQTYHDILTLKGIGPYTAAAIASVCFGEPTPVVDGNVIRFMSRLFGVTEPADSAGGRKKILELASGMMDRDQPGEFNQAMMEFGALYCKPSNPDCPRCIFRKECVAFNTGRVGELPSRAKKTAVTARYFHYLVVRMKKKPGTRIFLQKRETPDIWKGLFQFPLIESDRNLSLKKLQLSLEWNKIFKGTGVKVIRSGGIVVHKLSHRVIYARFYEVEISKALRGGFINIPEEQVKNYPLPRLIERFLFTTGTRGHG
jgi:A/G-specific adenine glycosylase